MIRTPIYGTLIFGKSPLETVILTHPTDETLEGLDSLMMSQASFMKSTFCEALRHTTKQNLGF